jgi:hypothetical protein
VYRAKLGAIVVVPELQLGCRGRAFGSSTLKAVQVPSRQFILALVLLLLFARPARAETTIGIQGLLIQGTHVTQVDSTPLAGAAALLEARQRFHDFDLDVEGAPSTGAHGYITSAGGAQPFTSFSLFSAVAHARIGPTGRYWAGGGLTVLNQITSVGSPPLAAASRVTGGRYQGVADLPAGPNGTVEVRAAVMPSLHGSLAYLYGGIQVPTNRYSSESAEATDLSIAYILRHKRFTYALGFRSINYIAYFVTPYELADKNAVYGPTLEVRWIVAK